MLYLIPKTKVQESTMRLGTFCRKQIENYYGATDLMLEIARAIAKEGSFYITGGSGLVLVSIKANEPLNGRESVLFLKNVIVSVRDYRGEYTGYEAEGNCLRVSNFRITKSLREVKGNSDVSYNGKGIVVGSLPSSLLERFTKKAIA